MCILSICLCVHNAECLICVRINVWLLHFFFTACFHRRLQRRLSIDHLHWWPRAQKHLQKHTHCQGRVVLYLWKIQKFKLIKIKSQFTKWYIADAGACRQNRKFPIMRLRSSFSFLQVEKEFCLRYFAAFSEHAFILEGKRLKSQELPAAGWRWYTSPQQSMSELKRKSILKKIFL